MNVAQSFAASARATGVAHYVVDAVARACASIVDRDQLSRSPTPPLAHSLTPASTTSATTRTTPGSTTRRCALPA